MSEEKEGINLFEELGVSDERAHEISVEINTIAINSEYLTEILSAISETYDRESIILGVFLCEIILKGSGRSLPSNMNGATIVTLPQSAKEILDRILEEITSDIEEELEGSKISTKGDPENN